MNELTKYTEPNFDSDTEEPLDGQFSATVIGRGEIVEKNQMRTVPLNDDTAYEKLCRERWFNAPTEKAILERHSGKAMRWREFYEAMEKNQIQFARGTLYQQLWEFDPIGKSHKRQAVGSEELRLPIAVNAFYALVFRKYSNLSDGAIWYFDLTTVNRPHGKPKWQDTGLRLANFQTAHLYKKHLFVITPENTLHQYRFPEARLVSSIQLPDGIVNCIVASKSYVAVVLQDVGFVVFQRDREQETLRQIAHENSANYTLVTLDRATLLAGCDDGTVEFWSLDGENLVQIHRQNFFISYTTTKSNQTVALHPNEPVTGLYVNGLQIGVSSEHNLVMWDATEKILCVLGDVPTTAGFAGFGNFIALLSDEGGVTLTKFAAGKTLALGASAVNRVKEEIRRGQQYITFAGSMIVALQPDCSLFMMNLVSMDKNKK
jgi:hypothetical protein